MGDREKAREEVQTALSIDPDFLAARMLRDELDAPVPSPAIIAAPAAAAPPPASLAASAAKLAQIEARVKERVKERQIVVPPPASRPFAWRPYRLGVAAAAIATFLIALSGSKVQEPRTLLSRASVSIAPLMESTQPNPIDVIATPAPAEDIEPVVEERPFMRPVQQPPALRPTAVPVSLSTPIQPQLQQLVVPPPVQALPTAAPIVTDSPPPAFVPRPADERALVEETLGRYRRAYNRLDAQSAQAVYPGVNAPALARAFDGLESQSLQFDECDIDVRGGSANVTCRGTSRYVTKIGSRDPHVEPRTWDFTLRKDQGAWKIENARAGR
jgi:hypothetical protein